MEHMAWRLKKALITVSCHDDLTASDLVGRFLISGGETTWIDGPLTAPHLSTKHLINIPAL